MIRHNRMSACEPASDETFQSLVHEWNSATMFKSNPVEIVGHPAFRRIVGMGKDAIPFILRDLKIKPSFLVYALDEITGESPLSPTGKRKVTEMTKAWIAWGEQKGHKPTRPPA